MVHPGIIGRQCKIFMIVTGIACGIAMLPVQKNPASTTVFFRDWPAATDKSDIFKKRKSDAIFHLQANDSPRRDFPATSIPMPSNQYSREKVQDFMVQERIGLESWVFTWILPLAQTSSISCVEAA